MLKKSWFLLAIKCPHDFDISKAPYPVSLLFATATDHCPAGIGLKVENQSRHCHMLSSAMISEPSILVNSNAESLRSLVECHECVVV